METDEFIAAAKIDAVIRQLDTAIWLWFNEGDLVSITQLAGSALGVVDELSSKKKKRRALAYRGEFPEGMTPREWKDSMTELQTFAKHARDDPDDVKIYSVTSAARSLYEAVGSYLDFLGSLPPTVLMEGFLFYFAAKYPEAFDPVVLQNFEKSFDFEGAKKLTRREFLERIALEKKRPTLTRLPVFHSGLPPGFELP